MFVFSKMRVKFRQNTGKYNSTFDLKTRLTGRLQGNYLDKEQPILRPTGRRREANCTRISAEAQLRQLYTCIMRPPLYKDVPKYDTRRKTIILGALFRFWSRLRYEEMTTNG